MINHLLAFLGGYDMEDENQIDQKQELLKMVKQARDEWHAAQNYFENVSDPELVDYAVYKIEASRRKYMYLLRLARKEGLENNQTVEEINNVSLS